jgi:hypothetical protein
MFKKLKERFSLIPMLKFPNFFKLFEVHPDASEFAIGGVLLQEMHLIAFENKKLVRA